MIIIIIIYLWNIRVSTKNRLDSLYKKQQGHQTMTVIQVKHKYQIHINTVWCIYVIIMKKNIIIIKKLLLLWWMTLLYSYKSKH